MNIRGKQELVERTKAANRSSAVEKKRESLSLFTRLLLSSPLGSYVGKIILFGSLKHGNVRSESDVDVLVLGTARMNEMEEMAAECAFETGLETGESVEPLVYCIDKMRYPASYFLYFNLNNGEEIYSMDEEKLRNAESRGYLEIAEEYLEGAKEILELDHYRIAVDAGYNAAELCVKGLLILVLKEIPSSHGGLILKFGEVYVKTDRLSRKLGRKLNQALAMRNKARYDRHATISRQEADAIIELAEEMIGILSERL